MREIAFLPVGASFLRTDTLRSMTSFSIASIFCSISTVLFGIVCFEGRKGGIASGIFLLIGFGVGKVLGGVFGMAIELKELLRRKKG